MELYVMAGWAALFVAAFLVALLNKIVIDRELRSRDKSIHDLFDELSRSIRK
jgi:hypothetical protein